MFFSLITFLVIVVLIIILITENKNKKDLEKEINKLKKERSVEEINTDETNLEIEKTSTQSIGHIKSEKKGLPNKERIVKKKEKKSINEGRNIAILVVGSIFIVLSAIVFLMSTWYIIPNLLKTIVLALLTVVFLCMSSIAKNKFKLEKTSKTFFYIAMAYIPICLISISLFKLLGQYLSIFGEGKYIYFTFSTLFISILYYYLSKYMKSNSLLYGSILSQFLSVIMFSLILSNKIDIITINLLIYNILFILLTKRDIFKKLHILIPLYSSFIGFFIILNPSISSIILFLLLSINYLILYLKNSVGFYSYMFNINLVLIGMNLFNLFLIEKIINIQTHSYLILTYLLSVYIIESLLLYKSKRKSLINSLQIIIISTIGMLHTYSLVTTAFNLPIIKPFIVSAVQMLLLFVTYFRVNKKYRGFITLLTTLYFIFTGISILNFLQLSHYYYLFFSVFVFIVGELFRKRNKDFYKFTFVTSHLFILLMFFISMLNIFNHNKIIIFICTLILVAVYGYSLIIEKNKLFKFLIYFISNFVLYTFISIFNSETIILNYIPLFTTLSIMIFEQFNKQNNTEEFNVYISISQIISFISIFLLNNIISSVLIIPISTIIIIYNIINKKDAINIIPLIAITISLSNYNLSYNLQTSLIILTTITFTIISVLRKQFSIFTVFSGIFLLMSFSSIENIYIKEIIFIIWTVSHMLIIKKSKLKDLFKFLTCISILLLYNTIIKDLKINDITAINSLGYITVTIFTLRKILINYTKGIDILEYIVFSFIYLSIYPTYNNEIDGMIFGGLIITIVFFSYLKKYGALFMISLFALLLNIIFLTRTFWLNIPWWIYLLSIGSILIAFAIRNEVNENKDKIKISKLLKNLKQKVDNKETNIKIEKQKQNINLKDNTK